MKFEVTLTKRILVFVAALVLISGAIVVYAATPNPGHDATGVGAGTFFGTAADNWIFPGTVRALNFMFSGTACSTGQVLSTDATGKFVCIAAPTSGGAPGLPLGTQMTASIDSQGEPGVFQQNVDMGAIPANARYVKTYSACGAEGDDTRTSTSYTRVEFYSTSTPTGVPIDASFTCSITNRNSHQVILGDPVQASTNWDQPIGILASTPGGTMDFIPIPSGALSVRLVAYGNDFGTSDSDTREKAGIRAQYYS